MMVPSFPSIGDFVDLPESVRMGAHDHPRSPYSWVLDNKRLYIYFNGRWTYAGLNNTTASIGYVEGLGLEY